MARARNIKPSLFMNDELAELGPYATVLFTGLWCIADRRGRLKDRPIRIKAQVLPYYEVDANALLDDLAAAGFIQRYEVDNTQYIQVVNFEKHQNPHKNEKESTIPAPCESDKCTVQASESHSTNPADSLNLIPDSLERRETPRPPAKRKTKFPHEELPEDWKAYCVEKRPDLNPDSVFENCRDHYLGKGQPMMDWTRVWQRWVRNERTGGRGYDPNAGDGGGSDPVPKDHSRMEAWAKRHGARLPRPGESYDQYGQYLHTFSRDQREAKRQDRFTPVFSDNYVWEKR